MGTWANLMSRLRRDRPSTAAAVVSPAVSSKTRRGSDASVSAASTSSSIVVVPQDGLYVSSITKSLLDSLKALIEKQKDFWSKTAGKNITLTPQHIELRQYILENLSQNVLGRDEKLRLKSVEEILKQFQEACPINLPTQAAPIHAATKSYVKSISGSLYNNTVGLVWKSAPTPDPEPLKNETMTDEQVFEDLTELFTPVIHSIKHDYTDDIEGTLRHWETRSTQSPPGLPFRYGNNQRADESIKIVDCAYQLKTHYIQVAENYNKEIFKKEGLEPFVKKSCELLQNYYGELLKLNADLKPGNMLHWKQESAKKALDFYFDQREYLYKIVSLVNGEPEKSRKPKIALLRDYKKFIKEKYEREAVFKTTIGPFAFGLDKWTKIDAAMEQYRVFCDLPGEEISLPASDKYDLVRCAGEDGELRELKGRGLYFRYGRVLSEKDPFKPLNIFGAVKPTPSR